MMQKKNPNIGKFSQKLICNDKWCIYAKKPIHDITLIYQFIKIVKTLKNCY